MDGKNTHEDNDRPLSPETLRAIEDTKKIAAIWEKLTEGINADIEQ